MKYQINYRMEELVPVVARLAEKLTGGESTSITYEKAEQLMEGVIFCIHELVDQQEDSVISADGMHAEKAYELGRAYAVKKVKSTMHTYNEIVKNFDSYGNRCLHDTFIKGLPAFFKWYDVDFEPQNAILTLDYPVLRDMTKYEGIDAIAEFVDCIRLEQKFLAGLPRDYVAETLAGSKDLIENICREVFLNVVGHVIINKPLSDRYFSGEEHIRIKAVLVDADVTETKKILRAFTEGFAARYYENDQELFGYLGLTIDDIAVRIKNAAENDSLKQVFGIQ